MANDWAARHTFTARNYDIPAIQMVVKRLGLRFASNPARFMHLDWQSVTVEGDDMPKFNQAVSLIGRIINSPVEDPKPAMPWWRRVFGG